MKHFYLRVIPFLFLSLVIITAYGQKGKAFQTTLTDKNGNPEMVQFDPSVSPYYAHEASDVLHEVLNLQPAESYVKSNLFEDQMGMMHEKYQQTYRGLNVEYGTYTIHSKEGKVVSLSGEYKNITGVDIHATLSESDALNKALAFVGAQSYMWENNGNEQWLKAEKNDPNATFYPKGELVICENFNAKTKEEAEVLSLAYKFDIYSTEPLSRSYVYVDAHTGKVIHQNSIIKTAVASASVATRYSGTQTITTDSYNGAYRLHDTSRGNGIITYDMNTGTNYNSAVDFTDADNNWTSTEYHNTAKDDISMECQWAFENIYDYWINVHGRNSFDNNGGLMKAYVHFDSKYDNAYWDGSVFTFGDGSDTYFDALAALDVSAHEHGHAVCSYTCDLAYQNESGALNEGLSDIWGACVENYAAPNKMTWVMGEDIERRTGHTGLRILSNPNEEGLPDTYQGTYWAATTTNPTSSNDYGGVHTNNGPICYWFYLVSVGGSGTNDIGNSFNVTGIGITKAEKIVYRMESVYFTSTTNYANARTYAIQAATDLYGATSNEVIQVTNAMYAVGVGAAYGGGTTPTYCTSKGSNYSYEWISSVTVGAFTKTSGASGYTNYTSSVIELTPGESYPVSLTPGFASTTYNEYFKIWIDYNGDADFSDAGELVYDAGALSKTTVTGSFTVPAGLSGETRMRVSMKYNAAQTECETFSYGEVEDYTVSFVAGIVDTQAPTAPSNLTASNVAQTSVNLSWTASTDNVGVTQYLIYRNGTQVGTASSATYQATGLTASTAYSFYVKAKDAAGNISAASNTVNVTTLAVPVDTQAPTAPGSLSASGVSQTALTLTWSASTDNVGVTQYLIYKDGSQVGTATTTSYAVTGLTASTTYAFYVKAKDAAGNSSAASSTINVTTLSNVVSYCASKGNNVTYEWIDLVELGTMSNVTSKNSGYGDFTSKVATASIGTNTIKFSAGFKSTSYTEYWHVWIDLNHNGTFDSDERLVYGSSSSSATLSSTLTIPTAALLGATRMRVTMKYNAAATACETFSYGEVEDYTVNIVAAGFNAFAGNSEINEQLGHSLDQDVKVYPNPSNGDLNIEFSSERTVEAVIYDISGRVVLDQQVSGLTETLDISSLEKGVYTLTLTEERKQVTTRIIKQ